MCLHEYVHEENLALATMSLKRKLYKEITKKDIFGFLIIFFFMDSLDRDRDRYRDKDKELEIWRRKPKKKYKLGRIIKTLCIVRCNKIETVRKWTLFVSIQLMNPMFKTSFKQILTFARHEHGRVGIFRIKMRSLVQKL